MADLNDPLVDLQRKINEARSHTDTGKNDASGDENPASVGRAFRFGIELFSGVAVGCAIGYYLDRWIHTAPLFMIVFFLLGAAAGFRNLIRAANEDQAEK